MKEEPPIYEEIINNTYAVHATHIYPDNGIMMSGSVGRVLTLSKSESSELTREQVLKLNTVTPHRRFTLHWALGGIAQDHFFEDENGNVREHIFSDCPLAILEPLVNLVSKSYGGHDQDWMILGGHRISKDAILISNKNYGKIESIKENFLEQLVLFNPEEQTLEQAVKEQLQKKKAYILERTIPVKQETISITKNNVNEMANLEPLCQWFGQDFLLLSPTERANILLLQLNEEQRESIEIDLYNQNNIPLLVNNKKYSSPKMFFTTLREKGYFWGKHDNTLFASLEKSLNPFFIRPFIFQAKQLYPALFENMQIPVLYYDENGKVTLVRSEKSLEKLSSGTNRR